MRAATEAIPVTALRAASEAIPATAWRAATVTRHHAVAAWGHMPHCFPGHTGQPGSIPVPQFAPGHFFVLSTCHYGILQRTRPLCAACHARPPCACLRHHNTKTTTLLIFFTHIIKGWLVMPFHHIPLLIVYSHTRWLISKPHILPHSVC